MDFSEILLLLIFVVLPLLQQFLGRRTPPGPPPEVERDEDERFDAQWRLPELPPAESPVELPRPPARVAEAEAPAREEAAQVADLQVLRTRIPPTEPEAARVSTKVVSLEPLFVHRPVLPVRRTTQSSGPASVTARRYTEPRAAMGLHSRDEIRRAFLLAEILGRPRSMD